MSGYGIRVGAPVRQVIKAPIEGVVVEKRFVEAPTEYFQYLVEWPDTDGDGVPQSKWFNDGELEDITPPEEGAPA